ILNDFTHKCGLRKLLMLHVILEKMRPLDIAVESHECADRDTKRKCLGRGLQRAFQLRAGCRDAFQWSLRDKANTSGRCDGVFLGENCRPPEKEEKSGE